MKTSTCTFGNLSFRVTSNAFITNSFNSEFGANSNSSKCAVDFYIAHKRMPEQNAIISAFEKCVASVGDCTFYENEAAEFYVSINTEVHILIIIKDRRKLKAVRYLPRIAQKFLSVKYMSVEEIIYDNVLYGAVLWWLFILHVYNGAILLHASSVKIDGKVYAFCAHGGVGKTSLCGWAFLNKNAAFISDDLLPVNVEGEAIPSEIFVHIYPYNQMENFLWKGKWSLRRVHWELRKRMLGPRRVCARKSAREVYPRVTERAYPIDFIVWLSRTDGEPSLEKVDVEQFVADHFSILKHELRRAFRFFEVSGGGGFDSFPKGFEEHVRTTLENNIRKARIYKFNMSHNLEVDENATVLFSELEKHQARHY